jgi:hypothetical protein
MDPWLHLTRLDRLDPSHQLDPSRQLVHLVDLLHQGDPKLPEDL